MNFHRYRGTGHWFFEPDRNLAERYAGMFGFHDKPYFQATAGSETPPKVQFDFDKREIIVSIQG